MDLAVSPLLNPWALEGLCVCVLQASQLQSILPSTQHWLEVSCSGFLAEGGFLDECGAGGSQVVRGYGWLSSNAPGIQVLVVGRCLEKREWGLGARKPSLAAPA